MKLCIFSHRLRAERAEPFAEGLALGVKLDGRGARTHAPVCGNRMGSVSGDRVVSVSGDRMGSVCGDRMGRFCGDRMRHRGARVDIFFILTNKRHPQQLKRLMRTPDMR